ncbi:hypothetical protein AQPE_2573 [Aquipluma nitroreducens]|uniref:Uncharacterized protein n=1 Tax=Aquipluma nitroreducens TaxID=2010828 RepID=A0A5K7SA03_9BACT|nr:hypothetical protein AQPE_2573 [Aquipluma nitroreducens]
MPCTFLFDFILNMFNAVFYFFVRKPNYVNSPSFQFCFSPNIIFFLILRFMYSTVNLNY